MERKVSVIIATFNCGHYLLQAVGSILAQSYSHIEIILVDSGSTEDNTRAIIKSIQCTVHSVIVQSSRTHIAADRNTAVLASTGEYCICLDGDNLLHPFYIEKAVSLMDQGYDIVSSDMRYSDNANDVLSLRAITLPELLKRNFICSASMFKRSCWENTGGYRARDGGFSETWDFWVACLSIGARVAILPEQMVYYLRHNEPLSNPGTMQIAIQRKLIERRSRLLSKARTVPSFGIPTTPEFKENSDSSSSASQARQTQCETRLFINYYGDPSAHAQGEIDNSLRRNLDNPAFDRVVILAQVENSEFSFHPKVVWVWFGQLGKLDRPTFGDFFSSVNAFVGSHEDISIIASADICFDETFARLKHFHMENVCIALTPWKVGEDGSQFQQFSDSSQACWIFQGRIKPMGGRELTMGIPGCDNKIAWSLIHADYRVLNPCNDIRAYRNANFSPQNSNLHRPREKVKRLFLSECGLEHYGSPKYGVIAFSLWGTDPRYSVGAIENAKLAKHIYPGWTPRFYHDDTVSIDVLDELEHLNAELIRMPRNEGFAGGFWRFLIAGECGYARWLIRDCDSRLNYRERRAVDEWIQSKMPFHILRDHPTHKVINAGICGGTRMIVPDMADQIAAWPDKSRYGTDEMFLLKKIFPRIQSSSLIHDAFASHYDAFTRPFPTERECGHFCGERCSADEHWNHQDRCRLFEGESIRNR